MVAEAIELRDLECASIELDIKTSYLSMKHVKGTVEIHSNLDMEITCKNLEGNIRLNQISATSRIHIPGDWTFSAVKKGIATKLFYELDGQSAALFDSPDAENKIELNGIRSELIISKYSEGRTDQCPPMAIGRYVSISRPLRPRGAFACGCRFTRFS